MRQSIVLAVLLVTAAWPMPAAAQPATIVIAELLPDPQGEREFVEVWNTGSTTVSLRNWTIEDQAGNAYTFGDHALPGGGRVVVWGGGEADARGPAWNRASVWNNGGDQAILKDAAGTIVDVFAYGSATWPDGRSDPVPDAPATNRSLSLVGDRWLETTPTPGSASASGHGQARATVQNVAPTVAIEAPIDARAGASFDVVVSVFDDNGDDIAHWHLQGDGVPLANGTAAGNHRVPVAAPNGQGPWALTLFAQDNAGANATTTHIVDVWSAGLVVIMPEAGLAFPPMPPGAQEVLTNATFSLRNDGAEPITPRIDISDMTGPSHIPLVGRLDIGDTTWTPYDGPLTVLPTIAPGETIDLRFRLRDIPAPLPAGEYGTSFTVIA